MCADKSSKPKLQKVC